MLGQQEAPELSACVETMHVVACLSARTAEADDEPTIELRTKQENAVLMICADADSHGREHKEKTRHKVARYTKPLI